MNCTVLLLTVLGAGISKINMLAYAVFASLLAPSHCALALLKRWEGLPEASFVRTLILRFTHVTQSSPQHPSLNSIPLGVRN
jgi:hypothetical protein